MPPQIFTTMKRLFLFALLLSGLMATGQTVGQFRYDTTKFYKVGGFNEVKIQNSTKDSVGGLFVNVGNGWGQWLKIRSNADTVFIGLDTIIVGTGSAVEFANGLSLVNDTAKLGSLTTGLTDSVTFIQVPANAKYAQFDPQPTRNLLVIHNMPYDSVKSNTTAGRFPYWLTHGSNQLLIMERDLYERNNDTADLQYSGILTTKHTYVQDHNSTRYDSATGKLTTLQNGGLDMGYTFFPAKNIMFRPSPFGNHGVTDYATIGIGDDSAYTITLLRHPNNPVPWSVSARMTSFNSSVPLDKRRIVRNSGNAMGMSGYAAFYKSGQGESSYTLGTGSKVDRYSGFYALGSMYRLPLGNISGKTNILATSMIDTSVGVTIDSQYTDINEANNGYAVAALGNNDASFFHGPMRLGPTGLWYNRSEFVPNRSLWVHGSTYMSDSLAIGMSGDANFRLHVKGGARIGSPRTTTLSNLYVPYYDTATTTNSQVKRALHVDRRVTLLDSTALGASSWLSPMLIQGYAYADSLTTYSTDYQGTVLTEGVAFGVLDKSGVGRQNSIMGTTPISSGVARMSKFSLTGSIPKNITGMIGHVKYIDELNLPSGSATIDDMYNEVLGGVATGGFVNYTIGRRFGSYYMPFKVTGVGAGYPIYQEGTADTVYLAGSLRMPNLVASDTSTIKPWGVDANGVPHKLNSWPVGSGGGGVSPGPDGTTLVTDSSATEWELTHPSKNGFYYFNDFFSPVATQNDGNGVVANNSSGTTGNAPLTAANHPGEISMTTGTGTTNAARIISCTTCFTFGGGATSFEMGATSSATLSDGTDSYQFVAGFLDGATVNQIDGAYFLYDSQGASTGSAASANWQIVTVSNSTRTFTTTSTAYAVNTYNKLKIEVNAAGTQVNFFIDGTLVGTHTTNIPTGTARTFGFGSYIVKSAGTSSRTVTADYMEIKQLFTTPR